MRSEVEKLRAQLAEVPPSKTSAPSLQEPPVHIMKPADRSGSEQMSAGCDGQRTGRSYLILPVPNSNLHATFFFV